MPILATKHRVVLSHNNKMPQNLFALLYLMLFCIVIEIAAEQVSLRGNGFMRYNIRDELYNPNVNRIGLQFRTTHPSGMLVYATGSGGDVLQLDIAQGHLRYLEFLSLN